jgi:hypothetical protein
LGTSCFCTSLQTSFGDLIIIIRNRAKTICLTNFVWEP